MCAPRVASAGPARTSRVPHASLTRSLLSESPWGLASCLLSFNRAERTFREITLYQDTARPRYDDTDTLHYNYKYAVTYACPTSALRMSHVCLTRAPRVRYACLTRALRVPYACPTRALRVPYMYPTRGLCVPYARPMPAITHALHLFGSPL